MTDKATPSLRQRCDTALQSLPDAAYKTMLAALFDDLLGLAAQAAPTEAEYNPLLIDGVQHDPLCLKVYRSPLKECDCGASSRAAQPSQAPVVQAVPVNCGTGYCSCIECVVEPEAVLAREYPPLPEGVKARFKCEDCGGTGYTGDMIPGSEFQPPEPVGCTSCNFTGWWAECEAYSADQMRAYVDADRASSGATTQAVRMLTDAARDVLAERQRQISAEGWTPEHDDEHDAWSMAVAAACYSLWDRPATQATTGRLSNLWQWTGWDQSWFKPKDPRRNLVRAAALLLAEIERLDRAGRTIPPSGEIGGAA